MGTMILTQTKQVALAEILLNFANDDASTTSRTISAIMGVFDCDGPEVPTLRDRFAMAALSMLADPQTSVGGSYNATTAKQCYEIADAMLEARKL